MIKYKLIKKYPNSQELGFESVNDYSQYPEFWQVVKEPLVMSEEKKPIYEGDIYYTVFDKLNKINPNWFFVNGPFKATNEEGAIYSTTTKYFIDPKAALQFIHDNKPVISIKDIFEIANKGVGDGKSISNLLGLAESKL